MEYVELQNASSFKLDKLLFRIDAIECVQKPIANDVGCIIVIQGQKYQVKEAYDYVKSVLMK